MKRKKILTAFLKYDYGIKERGESGEKAIMLPALKELEYDITEFWLEENGFPNRIGELQKRLLEFTEMEKPDIIFFILMNDEINTDTLEKLSKKYITVNWFCDDQWRFESFTKFVAPHLTYSLTVDKYCLKKYEQIGVKKVILSQWAVFKYIENIDFSRLRYNYDISFIGGRNLKREWIVTELNKRGYHVECFGEGWRRGRVSLKEMSDIFLHSKINLNLSNSVNYDFRSRKFLWKSLFLSIFQIKFFSPFKYLKEIKRKIDVLREIKINPKRIEQIKARNFEIPACGGFQLSQFALEIDDYFIIGKEIAVFSNLDELIRQIEYYLNNDTEREKIRNAGYKRCKNHTYFNRFKEIFGRMK